MPNLDSGGAGVRQRISPTGLAIVKAFLNYDATTGLITWAAKPSRRIVVGRVAGCPHPRFGYRIIKLKGMTLRAAHVAWYLGHSEWPTMEVDHINLDRDDNRLTNLRLATRSQNGANRGRQSNNTSGFKGVGLLPNGRWRAVIKAHRRQRYLGSFPSREEAHAAYVSAANELHGDFARVA